MARCGGRRPWPGRRRGRGAWLGHVALEGVRLAASRVDRAGSACPPTRSEPTGDGRGAVAAGSRGQPGHRRARRGDAGDGCRGRWRQWPGDHVCRSHRRGRGHRHRECRAHGSPGPATDRDVGEGRERRVDRPDGRLTVPGPAPRSPTTCRRRSRAGRARVTSPSRPRLVVQLDAPGPGGVWLVSVHSPSAKGRTVPIDAALRAESGQPPGGGRVGAPGTAFPAIHRSGAQRRGQLALTQDEAWEFMTTSGPTLAAVGFDVRVPAMSRRKATPLLRLFAEAPAGSVVGAHQLSNVAWSVLFDDVELTAAEVAQLARQARPLVQSRRGWVEIDRVDLEAGGGRARRARPASTSSPARRSCATASASTGRRSGRRRPRPQLGHRHPCPGRRRVDVAGDPTRRDLPVSCAPTRPRLSLGSGSSTPPSSADAWPSTWASARPRRCSPTSPVRPRPAPRS